MNLKKILTFIVILLLVGLLIYLATSIVSDKINQEKDVQSYCSERCAYNPTSFFWEFTGDYNTKGFTTEDECYSYCRKVRTGFAYLLQNYTAGLSSAFSQFFGK